MKTWLFALFWFAATAANASDEMILKRLYPKANHIEVSASAGMALNPAFVDTTLYQASLRYFFTETWGLGLTVADATTKNRKERRCVESFYDDPDHEISAACASEDRDGELANAKNATIHPAYPPIREIDKVITAYGDYSLAYGKLIILHGATSHFDLRLRFGGGMTLSRHYEEQHDARPEPRPESTPHLYAGVAEDLLFLRRFFVEAELATYMLVGAPDGMKPTIVVSLSGGARL